MRARKHKCPDCKSWVKSTPKRWSCDRCRAEGSFLGSEPIVRLRYITFSIAGGWRLNPFHPDAPRRMRALARAKAVVA